MVELFPDIFRFDSFQPTGLEDMIDARYEPSMAVSHVYTLHTVNTRLENFALKVVTRPTKITTRPLHG